MLAIFRLLAMALPFGIIFFPLFFLLPTSSLAQTNNRNITIGASLFAKAENSSSWLSSSGDFAFGFRQLQNQHDLFLLCVWYAKIPEKTIVWYVNGDQPAPRDSKVNLTADRGLVLTSPQGRELWKSETILGDVAYAVMSDEGNFVIQDGNTNKLWQTFNDPTDTILPSQVMDRGGTLSSRQSERNYSKGRFQLRLEQAGYLVLNTINLPTDYANEPYYQTAGIQLAFNESGHMYVMRENGERFNLTGQITVSVKDYYLRATLSFDGVFTQYFHPKSFTSDNVSWTSLWTIPDNICFSTSISAGVGVCGYNSICFLREDKRPRCECPKGYSLLNPNDVYGSCKPDFIQGCEEDELSSEKYLYDVVEVRNAGWPTSDYMKLSPSTEDMCKQSCLQDCFCAVAILREGTCWKKKSPLSNGRVDVSRPSVAFIKIRKDNSSTSPTSDAKKKDQDTLILAGSILLGSSVCANLLLVGAICLGFFLIYKKKNKQVRREVMHRFDYKELEEATVGFREELGRGTFGAVYKGELQEGLVAVKKLKRSVVQDGEREFKSEVKAIGHTHHKNLVHLIGYCDEKQHRLLVYEFMSNGTLAAFLFGNLKPSCKQRIEIAMGIARGLLYLHEGCSSQIIHCDIKPQNILLDDYYTAKISDFGLAKLLMMNQSQTDTGIRGTKGYVAPEWFRNMPITAKVDVYSFGVVLLEIICCRRNVDMEIGEEGKEILTDWAYDCYIGGTLDVLIDCEIEGLDDRKNLERTVMVAIWCIQENPSLRPNMRKVVQMLEGVVEVHVPPCPSPFIMTA